MVYRSGRSLPMVLILALLLALSASPVLSQQSPSAVPQTDAANDALAWLRTQQMSDGGFAAFSEVSDASVSADAAYAVAAAGTHPGTVVSAAGNSLLDYLRSVAAQEVANPGRAAKLVLALHVSGDDPRDVGGVDLVETIELGLNGETGWYGESFYGHLLAVLALTSQEVAVPDTAMSAILVAQTPEGSWGFNGDPTAGTGDSNTTSLAVQALVAAGGDQSAISGGLDHLRTLQNADTGTIAYDSYSVDNPGGDANSTALAIQAFIAAGVDPSTLEYGDPVAALLTYQNESGAFQFQPSFPDDSLIATAQVIPALLLKAFPYEPLPAVNPLVNAMAPATPIDGCSYHEVTQHNVCEPFAAYWEANGGLANFGYPLTEAVTYQNQTVQYFERAVFELHPENAGTPYDVLLTRVGWEAYLLSHGSVSAADPLGGECTYFSETGHNLCGGFAAFWQQFGGLAVFGYPITEEFQEGGLTVQYFERGRFEWHPGNWPERFDVLLGRLGADALNRELNH